MVQIVMLVVGVVYLFKWYNLGSAAQKLALPPQALAEWRSQRKKQYIWGIVAGWGSLVLGLIALFGVLATTKHCYDFGFSTGAICDNGDSDSANGAMIIVTLIVLIGGIILSVMAGNKAKAIEQSGSYGYAPGYAAGQYPAQPGWSQPTGAYPAPQAWGQPQGQPQPQAGWGQPGSYPPAAAPQPGWSQPPVQPAWAQPQAYPTQPAAPGTPPAQPGWAQPGAAPAGPQPGWGQPDSNPPAPDQPAPNSEDPTGPTAG